MSHELMGRIGQICNEIALESCPSLTISGGEPLILNKQFLMDLTGVLPDAFCGVYIATNGTWTKSDARRNWFLAEFLPILQDIAGGRHTDLGVNIELSYDQFHREQTDVLHTWNWLVRESEYYDLEHVCFSKRPSYMETVLPLGRGANHFSGNDRKEYCHFDGNDRPENQLTIWPDGRVSACCDGGAWVGNILLQDWKEVLRNRRRFLFHLRRVTGAYKDRRSCERIPSGVNIDTCADCKSIGYDYFKSAGFLSHGR